MKLGTSRTEVQQRAYVIANERMRDEILPQLGDHDPLLARLWNPLTIDFTGTSDYGLKLTLNDKLSLQLLRSDSLMEQVEQIVIESSVQAMLDEPHAFVTDLLGSLMGK